MSLRDHPPAPGTRSGRKWRVDEILAELPEEDGEALVEWLHDLRFSPEKIVDELRREGFTIAVASVASYRSKVLGIGDRLR